MNTRLFAWSALLFFGLGLGCRAETIVSVDADTRIICLNTGTGFKAYKLADKADLRVANAVVALDKLEPGMFVTFGLIDSQTINRLVAGPPPAPGAFTPAGRPVERLITIKLKVDGTDAIKVKNGMLWILHKGWELPSDISVNGHPWKPKWDDQTSNAFIAFTGPLAPFEGAKIVFTKVKGRGKARVTQQPTAENKQTLEFQFDDGDQGGADTYEAKISW